MYTWLVSEFNQSNWVEPLNPRELEVVGLLSEGLSNNEIAQRLYLTVDTIKWYNKKIFSKLGVKNRTQAANKVETLNLQKTNSDIEELNRPQVLSNLPAQLTSYIGRENEIAEIKELLRHNRMVSLTGSGGSGKTRLALKVADDLLEYYRDGVWFVELAVENDPERIPQAIAAVLKRLGRIKSASLDGLKRYLNRKQLMLILDNFEHLLEAAPLVADLLASCPKLTVLATSREKLHVYGEQEYPVNPLDLPDSSRNKSAEEMLKYAAVKLFVHRAKASKPDFVFSDDQVPAIVRICELLDGLPLAIELCAPQVKIFSPEGIVERLEASVDFIPQGPRDLPTRQRTLRAALEWSYNLLSKDESTLFARLAVFKGGGTLDAIEKVCGDGISAGISNLLFSLVDKNLVNTREVRDGEIYFTLLETIRDLNTERLNDWGVTEQMNNSHAKYYAEIAEQAETEIQGKRNVYWFNRLNAENDNLRAALWWSLNSQEPEFGLRLISSLQYQWHYSGLAADSLRWEAMALKKAANVHPKLRGRVLYTLGNLAYSLGDMQKSHDYYDQAVKLFQELGDETNEAWSKLYLGLSYILSDHKIEDGLKMGQDAFLIFRKKGGKTRIVQGLNVLGEIARVAGRYEEAEGYYTECLAMAKEMGETIREAGQYENLGYIAYHQKNYQLAMELTKKGLEMFVELDSYYGIATHIASFAGSVGALGYPSKAARLLGAANAQLDTLGIGQQPADDVEIRHYIIEVQQALGEEAFNQAWEEGQRMTIQEAIDYALSDLEDE